MLELTLDRLAQFGKPRLSKTDRGWYCCVDMFVTGKGVSFEIKSDFDHVTSLEAARVCEERLRLTLTQLASAAPSLSQKEGT